MSQNEESSSIVGECETLFNSPTWYTAAQTYWSQIPQTINGMLGGLGQVSPIDTHASLSFLRPLTSRFSAPTMACDCGAGIGRVTKDFLLKVPFEKVVLVEQETKFCETAREILMKDIEEGRVETRCCGLQDYDFEPAAYDLIWCQWVLGHLTDDDLVAFFKRCKKGLKPNGFIGVKENNCKKGYIFDEGDSSVTRSDASLKALFQRAGLKLIKQTMQKGFPSDLYKVQMYALEPM